MSDIIPTALHSLGGRPCDDEDCKLHTGGARRAALRTLASKMRYYGPWEPWGGHVVVPQDDRALAYTLAKVYPSGGGPEQHLNAAYMAACSPATILELLDLIESYGRDMRYLQQRLLTDSD